MSNEPGAKPPETPSFEESIRALSDIVKRLEEGDITLEESLKAFERGISLARDAQARLEAAEARVDELLGVDDQGRPITRPVAPPSGRGDSDPGGANKRGAPTKRGGEGDLPF